MPTAVLRRLRISLARISIFQIPKQDHTDASAFANKSPTTKVRAGFLCAEAFCAARLSPAATNAVATSAPTASTRASRLNLGCAKYTGPIRLEENQTGSDSCLLNTSYLGHPDRAKRKRATRDQREAICLTPTWPRRSNALSKSQCVRRRAGRCGRPQGAAGKLERLRKRPPYRPRSIEDECGERCRWESGP